MLCMYVFQTQCAEIQNQNKRVWILQESGCLRLHTYNPPTPSAPPPEEQFNVDPEQISRLKLNSVIAVMGLQKTEEGSPQG